LDEKEICGTARAPTPVWLGGRSLWWINEFCFIVSTWIDVNPRIALPSVSLERYKQTLIQVVSRQKLNQDIDTDNASVI